MKKYTKEQFIEAVMNSTSMRRTLQKLGVAPFGGNYATARKHLKQLNLDTSHWLGRGWARGKKLDYLIKPIEDYYSGTRGISTYKLKNRLLRDRILTHRCMKCNSIEWFDKPIPLELHHIDGNSKNNSLDNLQLLCPNCHTLTPNYRSKNNRQ